MDNINNDICERNPNRLERRTTLPIWLVTVYHNRSADCGSPHNSRRYWKEQNSMTQNTLASWNFYKGWEVYQEHLVRAIEPLTAEQLELKISPHLRSIGQLARHIVRTRAGWLYTMMGEGGPDVAAIAQWEYEGDVPSAVELVRPGSNISRLAGVPAA